MADKKKVVVAFSGGLDTSYTVMKLTQDGYEVYAACANTGGFSAEQLKKNEENAYKLGAVKYVTLDVTHDSQQLLPHLGQFGAHLPGHRHRPLCQRDWCRCDCPRLYRRRQ